MLPQMVESKGFICHLNVHTVMTALFNENYRQALNSSLISFTDGMPLVWFTRLMHQKTDRVYGPFFMRDVLRTDKKFKHFFLGTTDTVLHKMILKVKELNPDIQIVGSYSPPFVKEFSEDENQKMIKLCNESEADIVWIGLGAPKQELWAAKHQNQIKALLVPNGAAFPFLSGDLKQAPPLIQKTGLEWFFRLLIEPKRLWKRYLLNPLFVGLLFLQLIGVLKPKPVKSF